MQYVKFNASVLLYIISKTSGALLGYFLYDKLPTFTLLLIDNY